MQEVRQGGIPLTLLHELIADHKMLIAIVDCEIPHGVPCTKVHESYRASGEVVHYNEARVVHASDFVDGQAVQSRFSGEDHVELQVQRFDPVSQRMRVSNIHLADGRPVRMNSFSNQYTTPRELDLMARMAGLLLAARWSDWEGGAFTGSSRRHVSVYEAMPDP